MVSKFPITILYNENIGAEKVVVLVWIPASGMLRQEDHQVQGLLALPSKFKDILNNLLRLKIKRELGAKRKNKKKENRGVIKDRVLVAWGEP